MISNAVNNHLIVFSDIRGVFDVTAFVDPLGVWRERTLLFDHRSDEAFSNAYHRRSSDYSASLSLRQQFLVLGAGLPQLWDQFGAPIPHLRPNHWRARELWSAGERSTDHWSLCAWATTHPLLQILPKESSRQLSDHFSHLKSYAFNDVFVHLFDCRQQ